MVYPCKIIFLPPQAITFVRYQVNAVTQCLTDYYREEFGKFRTFLTEYCREEFEKFTTFLTSKKCQNWPVFG